MHFIRDYISHLIFSPMFVKIMRAIIIAPVLLMIMDSTAVTC